jgi:hypothetical protein
MTTHETHRQNPDSDIAFTSGQELSRQFYREAIRPALDAAFPGLPHSAALLGRGSEVLGYDDAMSTDHNWEPRVLLFFTDDDHARLGESIGRTLAESVPPRFRDHRTEYSVLTLRSYLRDQLDIDIDDDIDARDWLTFPEQRLIMMTAGAVYHDDVGLHDLRERFAFYPRDVWLYLLVAGWWRVHPEGNLVGRSGARGDELGSSLIGAALVHDLMRLCFLMERRYAPYSKWFGTAFARLECAPELAPILRRALQAPTWPEREAALMQCYAVVARMHDALHLTAPVPTGIERMWGRPYTVLWGDFPGQITAQITDPAVKEIVQRWPVGGIDQLRDLPWAGRSRRLLLPFLQ